MVARLGPVKALIISLAVIAQGGAVIAQVPAQTQAAPAPAPAPAPGTGTALKATLTGATEVPGPGDPDGNGMASVTIDLASSKLCYSLTTMQVEGVTMAHIHHAPMGSMGNVVVPLTPPTEGSSQGCLQVRPELAAAIVADPSSYYVNVHSEAHIAGAVRGQLAK